MVNSLPYVPDSAPFTSDQRAWLNGFLAGAFSETPGENASEEQEAHNKVPLTIIFGSQTGTAETLAGQITAEAKKRGHPADLHDMTDVSLERFETTTHLLVLTSTYGDGEPPDNAKPLFESMSRSDVSNLTHLSFSVLALGDTNYPKFCRFGEDFDRRLEELGAKRFLDRVDCDVDYEDSFEVWKERVFSHLSNSEEPKSPAPTKSSVNGGVSVAADSPLTAGSAPIGYTRKNPFPARLRSNYALNASGTGKETYHCAVLLEGSGLHYEPGDALGVFPRNCPLLVREILEALSFNGEETVVGRNGAEIPLWEALLTDYDITQLTADFVKAFAERSNDTSLKELVDLNGAGTLRKYCQTREPIDLLLERQDIRFNPDEIVGLLRKLKPRLYTISSSQRLYREEAHLTTGVVRYKSQGRKRKGVCSTFLADRANDSRIPVFIHKSRNFRLPEDPDIPIVMVGPGTGIAPFRAFLQERKAIGAKGRNWLFFGNPHMETDFYYKDELNSFQEGGTLTNLDLAFSRDQGEKVYVQHRMMENGAQLYRWLEEGAHFYVCGDAKRMAVAVEGALRTIIQNEGGLSPQETAAYLERMVQGKRYQRDVY